MADRRGVRASSRRRTATPQLPNQVPTTQPQPTRAPRARTLRSASRDLNESLDVQKPTRRSARQASVTSVTNDSDLETKKAARRTRRKPAKEIPGDLTTVEELDTTQTAIEELHQVPATPPKLAPEIPVPFRSPGALSEMSGTTAISSFSMVEAEFLEPKYILKHLPRLCDSTLAFLDHLAPDGADMHEDLINIRELQKPEAEFTEDYRDLDAVLNVYLRHYKNEENTYIHIRALHRALFGPNRDVVAAQTGLDLILYLTNALIFLKQTIYSARNSKETWDALRQLDNSFPSQFMRSLIAGASPTAGGDSGLFKETFELALELRTQLAILVLARQRAGDSPDEMIEEVFLRRDASTADDVSVLRGWNVPALGGDDSSLPQELEAQVFSRCEEIRDAFLVGDKSPGEAVTFLEEQFPWEPTILRLIHWVRLRRMELTNAIEELGGPAVIQRYIQQAIEETDSATERADVAQAAPLLPRKKRKSFGRDKRRTKRKFDPNAPLDVNAIDALKARERTSGSSSGVDIIPQLEEDITEPMIRNDQDDNEPKAEEQQIEEVEDRVMDPFADGNDNATLVGESQLEVPKEQEPVPQQIEEVEDRGLDPFADGNDNVTLVGESRHEVSKERESQQIEEAEEEAEEPATAGPPQNPAEWYKALKQVSQPQKENRPVRSIFDRQENARKVEFGNGFDDDSQPTPGPSNTAKGKQPAQSSPMKRKRPVIPDDDSEDEVFETHARGSRVEQQRQKAPVAKRVRMDPSSSSSASSTAPPSHQPPPCPAEPTSSLPPRRPLSLEERSASVTRELPPPSSYQAQYRLAQENQRFQARKAERKVREAWSPAEEEALMEYMAMFPSRFSQILVFDASDAGYGVLQNRTQVNLKDKVRTMAVNMIKSGTGLRPGFENIVRPNQRLGSMLLEQGYTW
ncbi:hypothetical protein IAQ61_002581 [Plenodomus lingam]|uniref:uncharacterized protein n=1 Tax=Leptosphaeria maculans TaxID=5022 RepID=UPI003330745B|nr:hypothetical protein IAQ61_002581 [Plenodomus lingam]